MTQHTVGVQNIRFGVLQLLLGNIGKPGTGVNALRESLMFKEQQIWRLPYPARILGTPNHDDTLDSGLQNPVLFAVLLWLTC